MRFRILLCAGVVAGVIAVSGCSAVGNALSPTARQADRRADTAGVVMTKGIDPVPTAWAASRVVGSVDTATIEAMAAAGTNWHGSAILRITITLDEGTLSSKSAVRCYRYRFTRQGHDQDPHQIDCPSGTPLSLAEPPPAPDLGASGEAKLRTALARLGPQRTDATAVRRAVGRAFPAPAHDIVTQQDAGTVTIAVRYESGCINATASDSAITVHRAQRTDCLGG